VLTRFRGSGGDRWSRRPRAAICGFTKQHAKYTEALYLEHLNGPGRWSAETHEDYIDALTTMNDIPVIQTPRWRTYSPEFWALTPARARR